jgi:signal transduction histidine kinase
MGAGEGRQTAGEDPHPAGAVHLPGGAGDRLGPGGRIDLQEPLGQRPDRLAAYRPLITTVRWATFLVGFVLAAPDITDRRWDIVAWAIALCGYALWRTFRPIRFSGAGLAGFAWIALDVVLNLFAVIATGYWDSPFVFSLLTAVITAGFAQGFAFALEMALTAAASVSIPLLLQDGTSRGNLRSAAEWSMELVLVAVVAGYGRRLFGEAEARHSLALDRMSRLAEANALLFSLHRVAQTLPASLDLDEVLDSTMRRLRDLLEFDTATLVLADDATGAWVVERSDGGRIRTAYEPDTLPPPVRRAITSTSPVVVTDLFVEGPGTSARGRSGVYMAIRARSALLGAIAVESEQPAAFTQRDVELLDGVVAPAALAIDNARWFARLRTVGADEERTRIARDLHDRIGQSLAYLAFELDRLARRAKTDPVHEELGALREDVRKVVSEVRETLYDLRTDVSEGQGLIEVLEHFLPRVAQRSGLDIAFDHDGGGRLAVPQERELWRIALDDVTNVEKHGQATRVHVRWWCERGAALLIVADNGRGLPERGATRIDAYGMLGMRERADAIGAQLEIESAPGKGTTVRCRLEER